MDQWLVAGIALVVFFAVASLWYIFHEEKKVRRVIDEAFPAPDNVETRNRRAF